MAEVKRGNGIPSLPLKKPLSFSHTSSSYKHIYDDVFASPLQSRQQSPTFIDDDYAEMFGSSRSSNGTWSISYSSIPVLDLPLPSDMRVRGASGVTTVSGERGGNVDYSGVFGGFGDGSFGLPDGEELFDQLKKTKTSSNVLPRSNVQTVEATRPEIRQFQNGGSSNDTFSQSSDSLHDFEQKKNGFESKKNKNTMRKSGEIAAMKKSGEMAAMKKSGEISAMKKSGEISAMKKSGEMSAMKKSGEMSAMKKSGEMAAIKKSGDMAAMKKSGEMTKVVHAHDFPVAPQNIEEAILDQTSLSSKAPVIRDGTDLRKDANLADKQGKHKRHTSMDIGANVNKQGKYVRDTSMDIDVNVQNDDASFHRTPGFGASHSVDTAHDTSQPDNRSIEDVFSQASHGIKNFDNLNTEMRNSSHNTSQPATGSTNLYAEPSDSTKHFDDTKMHDTMTSEEVRTTDVDVIHESTSTLHEVDCTESNLSSETSILKDDTETKMDVDTEAKQGKHFRNTSSELKWRKHESDTFSFEASQDTSQPSLEVGRSTRVEDDVGISYDVSQDTSQPSLEVGRSNRVEDDVGTSYHVRKKKGRHSRITSLDLGDQKSPSEQDEQLHRKPRFGGSYSFDASHDPVPARVKVQPSMMAPSSSVPQFFPVESHYKISENSSWRNFGAQVYKSGAVSPPFLDEQLDMNSDAGISVVALQKAIEEASMIIQMAKEYLEQESHGSNNVRFKDTLKVKPLNDEQLEDDNDEFQQTMTQVNRLQADNVKRKLSFLKDSLKVKVFQQTTVHEICSPARGETERHSASKRTNNVETGQPSPASEDQKNVKDDSVFQNMRNNNYRPLEDVENGRPLFSDRNSVLDDSQPSLISEDPKNYVREEECIEEKNPNMSNLINERDRQEGGGEWEAAKHLNQLISGVKNKLASFMTWQTDTEKKEEPKEIGASRKSQLQSEEVESGLIDVVNTEMKAAEKNQDDVGFPEEHVEIEIGFLAETVEPYENISFESNATEQGKADSSVVLDPVVVASPSTNFVFSPFRKEEVCGHTDSEEESNKRSSECNEIEILSARVEELNEMNYEQLQGKSEDHCPQDSVAQTDVGYGSEETNDSAEEPHVLAEKYVNEPTDEEGPCRSLDECKEDAVHDSEYTESTTERIDDQGILQENEVTLRSENGRHDTEILEEADIEEDTEKCTEATERLHGCQGIEMNPSQTDRTEEAAGQMHGRNEFIVTDALTDSDEEVEASVSREASSAEIDKDVSVQINSSFIEVTSEEMGEEASSIPDAEDEHTQTENDSIADTLDQVTQQATCFASVEDDFQQIKNVCSSEVEGSCINDDISAEVEEAVSPDENDDIRAGVEEAAFPDENDDISAEVEEAASPDENDDFSAEVEEAVSPDENDDSTFEIPNPSTEPRLIEEETVLFYDSFVELDGISDDLETSVLHDSQSDVDSEKEEIDSNVIQTEYEDIFENQTKAKHVQDSVETLNVRDSVETLNVRENQTNNVHDSEEAVNVMEDDNICVQEVEKSGVEAVQKRRRWFDNAVKVGPTGRPNILEGNITEVETDQEKLDESVLAGSVEVHADVLESDKQEVIYIKEPNFVANQDGYIKEPKRRRWAVNIGLEGLPVPPPLFQGINENLEEPPEIVNETLSHSKSESSLHKLSAEARESLNATDVDVDGEQDKKSEAPSRRKRWFGNEDSVGPATQLGNNEDAGIALGIDEDSKVVEDREDLKHDTIPTVEDIEVEPSKMEPVNDKRLDEVNRKEKEKEKERKAVERVIREARERAFVEAKERARRDASERPNVEARQKVASGAQETAGKVPAEARVSSDKSSMDAKLRAERAAVERATSEARERALQKSLSDKAAQRSREQAGKIPAEKNTSSDPSFQSSSSFSRGDSSNKGGPDSESAQRRKARSERQSRPMEQPATALEEKNRHDILIQKELAAKRMMEDYLDAEVKKWSAGKEGNLRLLLTTLQYILGPDSGWQTVSLTDLMATAALRKAYKKANLCVHPDKLQQRGATVQQKYICEKVFELLKDAWSKLNPDD